VLKENCSIVQHIVFHSSDSGGLMCLFRTLISSDAREHIESANPHGEGFNINGSILAHNFTFLNR
jgi:hypothetical protein